MFDLLRFGAQSLSPATLKGGVMIDSRRVISLSHWLLGLLVLCFAWQASAVPIVVTSRAALGGTDFIDWAQMGPDSTTLLNGFKVTSNSGTITADVSAGTQMTRLTQGVTWHGNFAPGDPVTWTTTWLGPVDIIFDTLVYGVGAQIQQNPVAGAFTATLQVYDASNTRIGNFSLAGNSTNANDNSAIFLGALDSTPSIWRMVYNTTNSNFAINQLDLVTVPSPSTIWLLGVGLGLLGLTGRRGRTRS
jgi:hypothetical protein